MAYTTVARASVAACGGRSGACVSVGVLSIRNFRGCPFIDHYFNVISSLQARDWTDIKACPHTACSSVLCDADACPGSTLCGRRACRAIGERALAGTGEAAWPEATLQREGETACTLVVTGWRGLSTSHHGAGDPIADHNGVARRHGRHRGAHGVAADAAVHARVVGPVDDALGPRRACSEPPPPLQQAWRLRGAPRARKPPGLRARAGKETHARTHRPTPHRAQAMPARPPRVARAAHARSRQGSLGRHGVPMEKLHVGPHACMQHGTSTQGPSVGPSEC